MAGMGPMSANRLAINSPHFYVQREESPEDGVVANWRSVMCVCVRIALYIGRIQHSKLSTVTSG